MAWARRNGKLLGFATVGLVALVGIFIACALTADFNASLRWWLIGAVPTAAVAAYLHALHLAFLASDPEAVSHLRGAWGEENTRSELQRARRKKLVWGWVDSIGLERGDLDHFVVTRRGGLVVVDSKWRNKVYDTADMSRAAVRARTRAEGVTRDLLKGDVRGRRRASVNALRVTPVVVLWGSIQAEVPEGAVVDGIPFVTGRAFVDWLARLDGDHVDEEAAAEIVRHLKKKRAVHSKATSGTAANRTAR